MSHVPRDHHHLMTSGWLISIICLEQPPSEFLTVPHQYQFYFVYMMHSVEHLSKDSQAQLFTNPVKYHFNETN